MITLLLISNNLTLSTARCSLAVVRRVFTVWFRCVTVTQFAIRSRRAESRSTVGFVPENFALNYSLILNGRNWHRHGGSKIYTKKNKDKNLHKTFLSWEIYWLTAWIIVGNARFSPRRDLFRFCAIYSHAQDTTCTTSASRMYP